jgi:hypothetical protein
MIPRFLCSLLVVASLVMSGIGAAQTRGAATATGQMVICTGTGTVVIHVDARGEPTAAPHICPDCLPVLAGQEVDAPEVPEGALLIAAVRAPLTARIMPHADGITPPSRAPPRTV